MRSIQYIVIACLALCSKAVQLPDGGLIKKLIPIGKKDAKSEAPSAAPVAVKTPTAAKAKKDKAGGDTTVSSPPSIILSDFPSIVISDVPSSALSDVPSDLASDAPSV